MFNTLEKWDKIMDIVLKSVEPDDPRFEEFEERIKQYKEVGRKLLHWGKKLNSQKKQDPLEFKVSMLRYHASFDDAFPNVPYWNKHHDDFHSPQFVDRF